jgi:hypothetical protein
MLVWCREALWAMLLARVWCGETGTEHESILLQIALLKVELFRFYTEQQQLGHSVTRIANLTAKMVGTSGSKALKLKAMETLWVCKFLITALEKYRAKLPSARLFLDTGRLLISFIDHLKACGPNLNLTEQQHALDLYKHFMKAAEPMESFTPKFHLMFHVILRVGFQGNPILYQTFQDEGLNKVLKRVLRYCHQAAFERMALVKVSEALRRSSVKRRFT